MPSYQCAAALTGEFCSALSMATHLARPRIPADFVFAEVPPRKQAYLATVPTLSIYRQTLGQGQKGVLEPAARLAFPFERPLPIEWTLNVFER